MTRVAVIGAGSWGTTVANVSAHSQPTMIWARWAPTGPWPLTRGDPRRDDGGVRGRQVLAGDCWSLRRPGVDIVYWS